MKAVMRHNLDASLSLVLYAADGSRTFVGRGSPTPLVDEWALDIDPAVLGWICEKVGVRAQEERPAAPEDVAAWNRQAFGGVVFAPASVDDALVPREFNFPIRMDTPSHSGPDAIGGGCPLTKAPVNPTIPTEESPAQIQARKDAELRQARQDARNAVAGRGLKVAE